MNTLSQGPLRLSSLASLLFFTILFGCFTNSQPARAQDMITSSSDLRVVANELPPFNYLESNKVKGFSVEVLTKVLNKAGFPFSPQDIEIMPWARAERISQEQKNAIIISIARTPQRDKNYHWIGPIHTIRLGLLGKKKRNFKIETIEDALQYKIGTIRDSAPEKILLAKGADKEELYRIATTEQNLKLLNMDRLDLFAHTDASSFFMMSRLGITPSEFEVTFLLREVELYIGMHIDADTDFVQRMQEAMAALKLPGPDGMTEFDRIQSRYFSSQ